MGLAWSNWRPFFSIGAVLALINTQGATHEGLLEDERFAAITSRTIMDVLRATRG
jgi:hypothetical protein